MSPQRFIPSSAVSAEILPVTAGTDCLHLMNSYVSLLVPENQSWCIIFDLNTVQNTKKVIQRFFDYNFKGC